MWECPLLMPLPYTPEASLPRALGAFTERYSEEHRRSSEFSESDPESPLSGPIHPVPEDPQERDAEKQAPLAQIAQDKEAEQQQDVDSPLADSQPQQQQPEDDGPALAQQALRRLQRLSMGAPGSPRRKSSSSLRRVSFSGVQAVLVGVPGLTRWPVLAMVPWP